MVMGKRQGRRWEARTCAHLLEARLPARSGLRVTCEGVGASEGDVREPASPIPRLRLGWATRSLSERDAAFGVGSSSGNSGLHALMSTHVRAPSRSPA